MTPDEQHYSLLAQAAPPRDLPIALAHCLVAAKPGTPRMEALNRLYLALDFQNRMVCNVEFRLCQMAKRGELRGEAV